MEITQQQFETNFEALQDEEKGMVAGIIENNEPSALQAFAKVLGVQFPTSIDEPMRPEDSIDYMDPRYSENVDRPLEGKIFDGAVESGGTGEEIEGTANSPPEGRDTAVQDQEAQPMYSPPEERETPLQEMQQQLQEGGIAGEIQQEGADESGVADDVPVEAEEGAFIINAAAVDEVGELDLEQRIIQP